MKKARLARIFALSLFVAFPAFAASNKPPTAQGEPSPQAHAAFAALPEAERKAAQDALGWLGFYNGVIDGAAGRRTLEAVSAYQQSVAAPADGIVTPPQLAAMKESAAKAKAALGFKLIDDPATGVRIGAPTKLLEKRDSGAGAAAMTSKDGAVGLYLKETTGELAALFKSFTADAGARKVTYKFLKPDAFFVTAGEEGDNKFYRRYAVAPEGGKLRGFAFIYPKARAKALDPVALALANSFDPFPAPLPPIAPPPTPAPPPPPPPPKLTATALVIAPGVAVTALDPGQCKAPTISGKPVHFLEAKGALAQLGGEFGAGAQAIPLGPGGGDLVALSLSGATLEVTPTSPAPGGDRVIAALGPTASGAPMFDRQGRLAAFAAPISAGARRAGVTLAAPHATISSAALGEAAPAGPQLTAPEIARLRRSAVVGVFCGA